MNNISIVESPYAGDIEGNKRYAIEACIDCFKRGEIPFASHLFYPQFLDNSKPPEREKGIQAGFAFWPLARQIVFYIDKGWSDGMKRAKQRANNLGYPFEERRINTDTRKGDNDANADHR